MRIKTLALAGLLAIGGAVASNADPSFWKFEWPNTDFETTTIDNWVEIMSGGPPKDGIPAIDAPQFITVSDETGLTAREAVISVDAITCDGDANGDVLDERAIAWQPGLDRLHRRLHPVGLLA